MIEDLKKIEEKLFQLYQEKDSKEIRDLIRHWETELHLTVRNMRMDEFAGKMK